MNQIEEILADRQSTYNTFLNNAAIADALIATMQEGTTLPAQDVPTHWRVLSPDQRLALQHIAAKIGRLLTGHTNHIDSWRDIAGYATLVADRLEGKIYYAPVPAAPPVDVNSVGEQGDVGTFVTTSGDFPDIEAAPTAHPR